MLLSRRTALIAGLASLALRPSAGLAATATRRFDVFRGDSRIGQQSVTVARDGARVDVDVRVRIDVRLIGLPLYTYSLDSHESWSQGRLAMLDARTDDNGTAHFARAERAGGVLRIDGSAFTGPVSGNPATTTYWAPAFLDRPVWISTQDGRPFDVTARRDGSVGFPSPAGEVTAARWRIGGDIGDLALFYDASGEWLGSRFAARGETARLVATNQVALTPLWVAA